MKPDDFEASLSRIPLRPPPPAWRDDILAAARAASPPALRRSHEPSRSFRHWLQLIPLPWAALAGTAAGCLLLNTVGFWIAPTPDPSYQHPRPAAQTGFAAAIRAHQSQVLALYDSEDSEPESHRTLRPSPSVPATKPRSDFRPRTSPLSDPSAPQTA